MRLLWLVDVLRAAGLTVHEYDGWRDRGRSTFGPVRGIVCHGTDGSLTSTDAGELRTIAITGSETATAPIAQLYQSRSGAWWVVASGTCTGVKTGTDGALAGYGDDAVLQIEAQHNGSEPWSEVQYRSYVRGVAALAAYREPGYEVTVDRIVGHYEHQPADKTDPWFDMAKFRRDVAVIHNGDDMSWSELLQAGANGGNAIFTAKDWLIGTNIASWRAVKLLEAMAQHIGIDDEELAAITAAAKAGALAGVLEAADDLVGAILDALPDEVALSKADVRSAAEAAIAAKFGILDSD